MVEHLSASRSHRRGYLPGLVVEKILRGSISHPLPLCKSGLLFCYTNISGTFLGQTRCLINIAISEARKGVWNKYRNFRLFIIPWSTRSASWCPDGYRIEGRTMWMVFFSFNRDPPTFTYIVCHYLAYIAYNFYPGQDESKGNESFTKAAGNVASAPTKTSSVCHSVP